MKKYILILLLTLILGCTSPVGGYIGKYKCSSLSGWCSNGTMVLGAFWDFPESIKRQYIPERPDRSAKGEELDAYWKAKAKIMSSCDLVAARAIGEQEITNEKEQCLIRKGLERNSRKFPSRYY